MSIDNNLLSEVETVVVEVDWLKEKLVFTVDWLKGKLASEVVEVELGKSGVSLFTVNLLYAKANH